MNINSDMMTLGKDEQAHSPIRNHGVRKDVKNNFSVCKIMIPFTQREKAGKAVLRKTMS